MQMQTIVDQLIRDVSIFNSSFKSYSLHFIFKHFREERTTTVWQMALV